HRVTSTPVPPLTRIRFTQNSELKTQNFPLKQFRHVERHQAVRDAVRHEDLLVSGIESHARGSSGSGDLLNRDSDSRRQVTIVVDTPDADVRTGVDDDPTFRRINLQLAAKASNAWPGSADYGLGLRIPTGGAVKNQQ